MLIRDDDTSKKKKTEFERFQESRKTDEFERFKAIRYEDPQRKTVDSIAPKIEDPFKAPERQSFITAPRVTTATIQDRMKQEQAEQNKRLRELEARQKTMTSSNPMAYKALSDEKQKLLQQAPTVETTKRKMLSEQARETLAGNPQDEQSWLQYAANTLDPQSLKQFQMDPAFRSATQTAVLGEIDHDKRVSQAKADIDARFPNEGPVKFVAQTLSDWVLGTKATLNTLAGVAGQDGYNARKIETGRTADFTAGRQTADTQLQRGAEQFQQAGINKEALIGDSMVKRYLYDFISFVPDMLGSIALGVVTGGAGTVGTLSAKQIGQQLLKKETRKVAVVELAKRMVVNPSTVPIGAKIFSQSYQGNLAEGMPDDKAFFVAFVNAYGQSVLEGGGLNKAFAQGGMSKAVEFAKASFGESFEEVKQNWWESAVDKFIAGKDIPIYADSLDGEALVNPTRDLYSAAVALPGAGVSGAIAAPGMAVNYIKEKTTPKVSYDFEGYTRDLETYEKRKGAPEESQKAKDTKYRGETYAQTELVDAADQIMDNLISYQKETLLNDSYDVDSYGDKAQEVHEAFLDEIENTTPESIRESLLRGYASLDILDMVKEQAYKNRTPNLPELAKAQTVEAKKPEFVPIIDTSKMNKTLRGKMESDLALAVEEGIDQQIVDMAMEGLRRKDIAKALDIEPRMVRSVMALKGIPDTNAAAFQQWKVLKSFAEVRAEERVGLKISPVKMISQDEAQSRINNVKALSGAVAVPPGSFDGYDSIQRLANRLGVDAVFYEGGRANTRGLYSNRETGTIFINKDEAQRGDITLDIMGHEFLHHVNTKHKDLYKTLREVIGDTMTTEKVKAQLDKYALDKEYQDRLSGDRELLIEEMLAEEAGSLFTDRQFWQNVYEKDATTAQKLVRVIRDFINRILTGDKKDSGNLGVMTEMQLKEFQKRFEDVVAEVMGRDAIQTKPTQPQKETELLSIKSLAESLGVEASKADDGSVYFMRDGKPVRALTASDVKKSPQGRMIDYAAEQGFIKKAEARKQHQALADFFNMISANTDNLQMVYEFAGAEIFSAIKSNADSQYSVTIDFSAICKKTQVMVDAMSEMMMRKGAGLNLDEIIDLYAEVFADGQPVPCAQCYVFSRWTALGGLLDNINSYQEEFASASDAEVEAALERSRETALKYAPKKKDAVAKLSKKVDGLVKKKMARKITDAEEAELEVLSADLRLIRMDTWLEDVRLKEDYQPVPDDVLFNLSKGDVFAGQYPETWKFRTTQGAGYGKQITPYTDAQIGEIIQGIRNLDNIKKGDTNTFLQGPDTETIAAAVEKARAQNLIGGFRYQSFSDFRYEYATDYLMAFLDLQNIGGMAQGYTKVIEAVDFIAGAGGDVNMSLSSTALGLKDGKVTFSRVSGINEEAAFEMRLKYDNAGTILIGMYDEHIQVALADSRIDFIIPFHSSGARDSTISAFMKSIGESEGQVQDYTSVQSDKEHPQATPEQIQRREVRFNILNKGLKWEPSASEKLIIDASPYLTHVWNTVRDPKSPYYGVKLDSKAAKNIMPWEYWDRKSTLKKADVNSKRFIEYAESLGIVPRFTGKMVKSGKVIEADFGNLLDLPGGWKTLIDRRMYDNKGKFREQKAINLTDVGFDVLTPAYGQANYADVMTAPGDSGRVRHIVDRAMNQDVAVQLITNLKVSEQEATLGAKALKELEEVFSVQTTSGREVDGSRRVKTIARDYTKKLLNQGKIEFEGKQINHHSELAVIAQVLRDPRFETFRMFFLDDAGKIVAYTGVSSRMPGSSAVFVGKDQASKERWLNDTLHYAKTKGATNFYLMHNHPSGIPSPSGQDYEMTGRFAKMFEQYLDFKGHIVINSNQYGFIEPGNFTDASIHDLNLGEDKLLTPDKPHALLGRKIGSADDVVNMARELKSREGYSAIFYMSPGLKVRGIQEIPSEMAFDAKKLQSHLVKNALDFGGHQPFLVAENDLVFNSARELINKNYLFEVINGVTGDGARSILNEPSLTQWQGREEGVGEVAWEDRVKYSTRQTPQWILNNAESVGRRNLISILEQNDPNGVYSDQASLDEGFEPLTFDEALELVEKAFSELNLKDRNEKLFSIRPDLVEEADETKSSDEADVETDAEEELPPQGLVDVKALEKRVDDLYAELTTYKDYMNNAPEKLIKDYQRASTALVKARGDGTKYSVPTINIEMDEKATPRDLKGSLAELYRRVVDTNHPLNKVSDAIKIKAANSKLVSGSIDRILTTALVDRKGNEVGRSWQETTKDFMENKDFWMYMAQKHNIDRAREGKPVDPGMTPEDSMAYVADVDAQHPEYRQWAQDVTNWIDDFMRIWAVDSGIIDADTYDEWRALYPSYFPTYREFSELEDAGHAGPGRRYVDLPSPVKKATGSGRDITNPVGNVMQMVNKVVRTARYNEVGQTLLDTIRSDPQAAQQYAEEIPPNIGMFQSKKLDNVITIWEGGSPQYLQINDMMLLESLKGLPRIINNAAVMRKVTGVFKGLITQYNPLFALRNIFRDIPTAYVYGSQDNPLMFLSNLAKAGYQIATDSGGARIYKNLGGAGSGQFSASEAAQYAKLLQPSAASKLKAPLRLIQWINEITEQAPRISEFNFVLEKTGSVDQALYAAQNVTVNFARGGDITKQVEPFVPYLNASVQGLDRFFQAFNFKKDPKGALKRMAKAGIAVTVPQIASYLVSMADDEEKYKMLDQRTKDAYYVFPKGDGTFWKIPKSRELGVLFGSLFERALTGNFKGFAGTVATNFTPVDPFTNNIFAPLVFNLAMNKDFANRTIVPQSLSGYSPEYQYDDNTSEIAKISGRLIKALPDGIQLSPKQIDYLMRSYTGVIGQFLLPATTERSGAGSAAKRMTVGAFSADPAFSSQPMTDFYDRLDTLEKAKNDKNRAQNVKGDVVTPEERMYSAMNKISSSLSRTTKYINSSLKADDPKIQTIRLSINSHLKKAVKATTLADLVKIQAEMSAELYKLGVR